MRTMVLLLAVMLLFSCNIDQNSSTKEGTLTFQLPGGVSRSLESSDQWYECNFKLIVTDKSNSSSTTKEGGAGQSITINGLRAGTYTLKLEAYKEYKLLCVGETDVKIIANSTVNASIDLKYETGGVNIGINTPESGYTPVITFSPITTYSPIEPYSPSNFYSPWRGPAGGWVFYDDEADGVDNIPGYRYLEAATADLIEKKIWGSTATTITNGTGTAIGTGKQNTDAIIASDNTTNNAAHACNNYSIVYNGVTYDDWFLPSKDELKAMFLNLKSIGLGDFLNNYYWSSSESSNDNYFAWVHHFYSGQSQGVTNKYSSNDVRPIRAF